MKRVFAACLGPLAAACLSAFPAAPAPAVDLTIKSRAIPPGHNGSIPTSLANAGGTGQIWSVDLALSFDNAALQVPDVSAAFVPFRDPGIASDDVYCAVPSVGSGVLPNLAFSYTCGIAGLDLSKALGLVKLRAAPGAVYGAVVPLTVPSTYNVGNTGNGSTTNARPGATATTSSATMGAAVASEPVNVLETAGSCTLRVPLHRVAIGIPGDVVPNGALDSADMAKLYGGLSNLETLTDYMRIASDVAPLNSYTPANVGGTNGFSYGDYCVNAGDLALLVAYLLGKPVTFPAPE